MSTNQRRDRALSRPALAEVAPTGQTATGGVVSATRVDEIFVTGEQPAIVRGEEQDHGGDVLGQEPALEALGFDQLGLALGRVPLKPGAACGCCPARRSSPGSRRDRPSRASARVSPSTAALQVWYKVRSGMPRCQEIEPRLTITPAPFSRIPGITDLAQKNWCLRFTSKRSSPIVLGDVVEGVAVVIGGIVDQYVIGAARLDPGRDRRTGRGDVGEIDMLEARVGPVPRQAFRQVSGFLIANIEEGHVGALPDEAFDDAGADAGAAARHQDAATRKARIDRAAIARNRIIHWAQPPM
jgi:hypothetical protein